MTQNIRFSTRLGAYQELVNKALSEMDKKRVVERIWSRDHTVWKPFPAEITNRLGWLDIAARMKDELPHIESLAEAARADGYTNVLLFGMGGSSLAPEVFRKTFGVKSGCLDLAVLDCTDPGAVKSCADRLDFSRTLFIVSSKSGGTVETVSFFKFFYNRVAEAVGADRTGDHFIAITDPGSMLAQWAGQCKFRETFLNDPNIGGRFSALSLFGLVPAGLIGANLSLLLEHANAEAIACGPSIASEENTATRLGAVLGVLAKTGRDKLTLVISPRIASFGDWVEQLIAESTGKEGRGILPVAGETPGPPDIYGDDRFFVYLRLEGDKTYEEAVHALEESGFPVVRLSVSGLYGLGAQFFLWEMATAVAGSLLGINPFNQPNVEASKEKSRGVVRDYAAEGELPVETPMLTEGKISVYYSPSTIPALKETPGSPAEALSAFLSSAKAGDYVAFQAYLQPTAETDSALQALRYKIRNSTRLATTVDYGPRYLHSTGQLHKGDSGNGLFIQLTVDDPCDLPIPDEAGSTRSFISFGVLKAAQAIGDRRALLDEGRRVIRFHLGDDAAGGLKKLIT